MIRTLHVLSVGSEDSGALVRDALLARSRCRLFVASSTWELSVLLGSEDIDVAVLHNTYSAPQMRVLTAYIRRRWPFAKILLIHREEQMADYSIYDERLTPDVSGQALLKAIERLGACARRARLPLVLVPFDLAAKQSGRPAPGISRAAQKL